jgi:hypothetical protein
MNIINNNKRIKKNFPCFYEYFTELHPQKTLRLSVEVEKYGTKSYKCSKFYKNISIFSL